MEKEEELKDLKDRAQVRLLLWLGLEKDQEKWTECCGGGEVAVFAETVSQEPPPVCSLVQHISMCYQGGCRLFEFAVICCMLHSL